MKEESLGAQILKRGLFELKIMENGSLGPQNMKYVMESLGVQNLNKGSFFLAQNHGKWVFGTSKSSKMGLRELKSMKRGSLGTLNHTKSVFGSS
jgi:hypothetical protein